MIKDNFLLSCFLLLVTGMLILGCQGKTFDPAFLQEKAPAEFNIRFETTKGDFDVRIYAAWSPLAADRLYQLVKHKYLTILFSTGSLRIMLLSLAAPIACSHHNGWPTLCPMNLCSNPINGAQ